MGSHGWSSDFDAEDEAREDGVLASPGPRDDRTAAVGATPARPLHRSPSIRVAAILALIISVMVGVGNQGAGQGDGMLASLMWAWAAPAQGPTARPAASSTPLGAPQVVPDGGAYRFMATQANSADPVAYDPCRPLPYVINLSAAPPGGELLVHEAVTVLQQVTGLNFVYEGVTDEQVALERAAFLPERYGDRWAPILIGWSDASQVAVLAGDVAGIGGSTALPFGDQTAYVTGVIALDGPQLGEAVGFGATNQVRAVIVHELAHVLGLDHVDDPSQLMYDRGAANNLGAGDLAGLARLGAGACIPRM